MNKSRRIGSIIAILCIVLGVILLGIGFGLGGRLHSGWGINFGRNFGIGVFNENDIEETLPLEEFDSINLDLAIGDITIKTGDTYKLVLKGIEKEDYTLHTNDRELTFSYEPSNSFFNFNIDFVNDYEVILYIPKDAELKSVKVDSAMGDIDISDIVCSNLEVEQVMGGVQLENVKVIGDTVIDQKMGDIAFSGLLQGKSDIHNSMGGIDVVIHEDKTNYRYNLDTSMGSLRIKDTSHSEKDGKNISGGNQNAPYELNVDNSMGDIELEFNEK